MDDHNSPPYTHANAAPTRPRFDDVMFEKVVAQGDSPEMTEGQDSLSVPYGSYHQLYRIDGKLVAVGVVDILPKCLVSFQAVYQVVDITIATRPQGLKSSSSLRML